MAEKELTKEQEAYIEELKSLGQARAAIYEFLIANEFELTEARHKHLKKLINAAVRAETETLVREKAELSSKLDLKFSVQAMEVFRELKNVNTDQFKRLFKPKHQGVLQIVIKRLHQYLEGQKEKENA